MNADILVELTYLLSAILFVVGLKRLQSPATARGGNALASFAMLLAIIATLVDTDILGWTGILVGVAIGGIVRVVEERIGRLVAFEIENAKRLAGIDPGYTVPSEAPKYRIDYIWLSPDLTAEEVVIPASEASDHMPVVATVLLR